MLSRMGKVQANRLDEAVQNMILNKRVNPGNTTYVLQNKRKTQLSARKSTKTHKMISKVENCILASVLCVCVVSSLQSTITT